MCSQQSLHETISPGVWEIMKGISKVGTASFVALYKILEKVVIESEVTGTNISVNGEGGLRIVQILIHAGRGRESSDL